MTKRTYRDLMEELQTENMQLKKQIRELKKQLETQVFDERPLDKIISDCKGEKKELSVPVRKNLGHSTMLTSDFMSQYRKYRQLVNDDIREMEIEADISTIDFLKSSMKQKPA